MEIRGPSPTDDGEDRFVRCEEAIETAFQSLLWQAVESGWGEGEACVAIASLADHHILAMGCNRNTEEAIRKLKP